jgi:hypothetical protein
MMASSVCSGWLPRIDSTLSEMDFDMTRTLLLLLGILFFLPIPNAPAIAADMGITTPRTVHTYIKRERRYYVGCPDGYSCYPLYGAYGPYGGKAYWAAYTGWYR